ncbi:MULTISPECIES: 50S ribosomal protein L30 [Ilyobacter]|jgi:large subunit ribosomal protein L30|uniref:Large ribosomal subunit protein uL30 n=1 Tax=Ilyobacter polytropus (strain ATCC 51220 / DSM 2926 / LMG 16218 / CuHBu1) TaxID=572544 RepID=E3H909_ILYPC|nr:50S ribosomal protein L30 [Ilyobacter polytropus]ADO83563.1 LSU ribosomal protein L30P [Ilyobacter polytropus DSM 2926]
MAKLRIKLVKSMIGRKPNHIATVKSLGLKKINNVVELEATPDIVGKVHLVSYLLNVEEV